MPKSVLRAVVERMQFTLRATRRTPHGASRLAQTISAWLVKTRRAPPQHSRDARVYGHTTMAMHILSTPPPPQRPLLRCATAVFLWCHGAMAVARVASTILHGSLLISRQFGAATPCTPPCPTQVLQILLMVFGVHAVEAYFLNPQVSVLSGVCLACTIACTHCLNSCRDLVYYATCV